MKICNSCGSSNNDTSKFCEACGSKFTSANNLNQSQDGGVQNTYIRHGVSIIIGAFLLLLIVAGDLTDKHSSQENLDEALGALFVFGCWIIPHSIWILGIKSSNKILPIIALVILALCGMIYVGSLPR